ncbi:sensor histidine kinase YvcQ [Caldalkalibacillus thermarum]|uniref:HAMP domain-containing histidine kinase n=1 Tax=Caldalkalibacillus thermarum TaxID=296745 RepID=UPI00166E4EE9|nr:HAMP domain-containing histidine kinase [Caldalkalibacillus thermarum]GGK17812.1 sensor histidine kinase YvcQ [Caldalkalibacillus thermarum]
MYNSKHLKDLGLFIKDRWLLILAFFLQLVLVVVTVQLELVLQSAALPLSAIVYLVLLSLVILTIALTCEYLRQAPFRRRLQQALDHPVSVEEALVLSGSVSSEQQAMERLSKQCYRRYVQQLESIKERHEQHLTFIKQWVHHMKTPLSVLHLTFEAIEKGHQHFSDELLRNVQEELERLSEGLHMMLHTARLGQFEVDVHIRQVDLEQMVKEEINSLKNTFIRSQVYPKLETTAEQLYVESDQKWLSFVIRQILTNAIKYSYQDHPTTVTCRLEKKRDLIQLTIADEGIGIPPQDLKRVFQPFFTGENGRKRKSSTGMGLYLVKQVCDRLGHGVTIHSVEGQGTKVTISFKVLSIYKDVR